MGTLAGAVARRNESRSAPICVSPAPPAPCSKRRRASRGGRRRSFERRRERRDRPLVTRASWRWSAPRAVRTMRESGTISRRHVTRRQRTDEQPSQFVEALAGGHRSRVAARSRLAEARFNRALILERLGVLEKARKAWAAYLDLDNGSEWSVEAREHLRELGPKPRRSIPRCWRRPRLLRSFARFRRRRGDTARDRS